MHHNVSRVALLFGGYSRESHGRQAIFSLPCKLYASPFYSWPSLSSLLIIDLADSDLPDSLLCCLKDCILVQQMVAGTFDDNSTCHLARSQLIDATKTLVLTIHFIFGSLTNVHKQDAGAVFSASHEFLPFWIGRCSPISVLQQWLPDWSYSSDGSSRSTGRTQLWHIFESMVQLAPPG